MLHYTTLHILASTSSFYTAYGHQSLSSLYSKGMVEISGEFPDHSRMGISLHSRNVLVLLKL